MVSALFVREDSVYKSLGIDCYDINRDARNFKGCNPVVCHPPCRAWGRLAQFANPRNDEKELAIIAVEMVRKFGGVLEHPFGSTLWKEDKVKMPLPGIVDGYGGYTLCVNQSWWGHKAEKKTFLYIVGCTYQNLPPIPIRFDVITHVVRPSKNGKGAKIITKKEREATPISLAKWLIDVALKCKLNL